MERKEIAFDPGFLVTSVESVAAQFAGAKVIRAANYHSKFATEPHLNLWIEGEPLQEWLQRQVPDAGLESLVPAWLGWLTEVREQELVRERMSPRVGERQIVPILVCPDDLDLSCTLVVAEVTSTEEVVIWEWIGLDITNLMDAPLLGGTVNWFALAPLHFPRAEYLTCVESFRILVDSSTPPA